MTQTEAGTGAKGRWRRRRVRALLPALLLVVIALTNRVVVARTDLSPWELGGFGMFSTTDAPRHRVLRVTGETAERATVVLDPGPGSREAIDELLVFPTEARSASLAQTLQRQQWRLGDGDEGDTAVPGPGDLRLERVEVVVGRILFDERAGEIVFDEIVRAPSP